MINRRILPVCLALALAGVPGPSNAAPPAPAGSAEELVGLWKARRWFGPESGALTVEKAPGGGWTADFLGQSRPVVPAGRRLTFETPHGRGVLRGDPSPGRALTGHWYPSPLPVSPTGFRFATPFRLEPDGRERWRGPVAPLEDTFTFYLAVEKRPDGKVGAYLRNPDRNWGLILGVDHLVRVGNVVKLIGKRRGTTEVTEQVSGSYDPASKVITLAFANRGGTYDFRRDGDSSDFYPRGKNPGRYAYRPPPERDDGWPTGTLEETGIDRAGIERFVQMLVDMPMDGVHAPQIHGVLVARKGKLVLEEYFHGEHRDKLHDTRSASKSLTATVVGAAIQAGAPLATSTRVYEVMNGGAFPKDIDPRKRAMTVEHLLTMSSGYFCDDSNPDAPGNEEVMLTQTEEPDYYRFALNVPMATMPGEKAVYCSINPNLALGVVGRATGESALETFDRLLGEPLKIRRYAWILDPASQPFGGGSVQLTLRDFAKLGQLMLDGGTWKGRRLLSREFVARASAPLYPLQNISYGYLWWNTELPYKDRKVRAFFAGGNGGQALIVIPELALVVGTFAANYADRVGLRIQQEFVPNYVLPAVREPGDDPRAPVLERDYVTPYGRRR